MKTIAAAFSAACLMTVSYNVFFSSSDYTNRRLSDQGARPVMHTFFSPLRPNPDDSRKTTAGMTADAHTDMIRAWKESWQQAGWDTRVLTIEDAKQHPDYNYWDPTIQSFKMSQYDKYCFYRWIAMAAVGGGWMSDYDTLPLHDFTEQGLELPMGGAFVVYGVFVPALLSGNASEWTRLVHAIVDYAARYTPPGANTLSDMMSLLGLMEKDPSTFISRNEVIGTYDTKGEWTKEFCQRTFPPKMRAMHFSHYFIHDIWNKHHAGLSLDDRGKIAKKWMEDWLRLCQRQSHPDVMATSDVVAETK